MKIDKRVEVLADKIFGLGYEEDLEGITWVVAKVIAQALIDSGVLDEIETYQAASGTSHSFYCGDIADCEKHNKAAKEWTE